jgi:hypothetical protein
LKGSDDPSANARKAIQGNASNRQSPASNWSKPLEALALEWFYMLFHKNDHNNFVTAGRKLNTKTFELVTDFFEA